MEIDSRLRKLQMAELEILKEFVRLCEAHGLQYYLVGGTLLGAVRHKGFIPWDDDIDVAMPRGDYDRFAQIAPKELDPRYFYQCPDTDPHYFLTYVKVRKNDTEIYEERFKNARFHKGIFIDIFPLDLCPKPGAVCHLLFNVLAVMNYRGQVDSGERYEPYREISGKIGYAMLRLFSPKQLVRARRRLLKLSRRLSRGAYVASYSGAYGYYKEIFPAEWFQSGQTEEFELLQYSVPSKTALQLGQIFGTEYMTPPPPELRKWHCDLEQIKWGEMYK